MFFEENSIEMILTEKSFFLEEKCTSCEKLLGKPGDTILVCPECHKGSHEDCWEKLEKCPNCNFKIREKYTQESSKDIEEELVFTPKKPVQQKEQFNENKFFIIQLAVISIFIIVIGFFVWSTYGEKVFKKHKSSGITYYKEGKFYDSEKELLIYTKGNPLDPEGLSYLSLTYLKQGKQEEAIRYADMAFKVNSRSPLANFARGCALILQKDTEIEGISYIKRSLELDPDLKYAQEMMGEIYYSRKELDKAEKIFTKLLKIEPSNYNLLNSLGLIYYDKGDNDTALKYYLHSLDKKPDNKETWFNIGNVYYKKSDYPKAVEYYEKMANLAPGDPRPHNYIGLIYYDKKEFEKAMSEFTVAVNIDPNYGDAYNNIGNVYLQKKELDKAIKNYEDALNLDKENVKFITDFGLACYENGDYDKALSQLKDALILDPNYPPANRGVADVYYKTEEWKQAIQYYERYLEVEPLEKNKIKIYSLIGECYYRNNIWDKSIKYYRLYLKVNPGDPVIIRQLGLSYEGKRDFNKALELYNNALTINPDYVIAKEDITRIYDRLRYNY